MTSPIRARPFSEPSPVSVGRDLVVPLEAKTDPVNDAISPSLRVVAGPESPAFEMKFLVSEDQAQGIEELARVRLSLDPHGDPELGNGYRTTTLYCDTVPLDVYYRVPPFQRRKHRLRRYGSEPCVFLERKFRRGDRVKKRRSVIPEAELAVLSHPFSTADWAGHWFHRHLLQRGLRPVCRIAYWRVPYIGNSHEGPMRLTLDRSIRGCLTDDWGVDSFPDGVAILTERVVCELKFRSFMPTVFKQIVQAMQLTPIRISKYRTFMQASIALQDQEALYA